MLIDKYRLQYAFILELVQFISCELKQFFFKFVYLLFTTNNIETQTEGMRNPPRITKGLTSASTYLAFVGFDLNEAFPSSCSIRWGVQICFSALQSAM